MTPGGAVDIFAALLRAEACSLGISLTSINVPSAITVADGGIDAEVSNAPTGGTLGVIYKGLTRYQIKTGALVPSRPSEIRDILLTENKDAIKPKVKSCFDAGGTLVVVLFGYDNPDPNENIVALFQNELSKFDKRYANASIQVWQQNHLIGFFEKFPSLALRTKGMPFQGIYSQEMWSNSEEMRRSLELGEQQEKFRDDEIRTVLRESTTATLLHIFGEPGIGKTRIVTEALGVEDLAPLVLYVEGPSQFMNSSLYPVISMPDSQSHAIVVIDDCDQRSRSDIWNRLKNLWPRIKLVTIAPEETLVSGGDVRSRGVPPLSNQLISNIISGYGIPEHDASRWSELCDGSPRVAHVIGQNLRDNPDDVLREPSTSEIWERYIAGPDDRTSSQVQERRTVLQFLALFKRFGYESPVDSEEEAISSLIEGRDGAINQIRFREAVKGLRKRKVLQGDYTLYITPKAFHIKLWTDWWETYGFDFDMATFEERLPATLVEAFQEMFIYAANSQAADRVVGELLSKDGPFDDSDYFRTSAGGRFFLALTEGNPTSAMRCLQRTVDTWSTEELQSFTTGRWEVVWALERIVVWAELFEDGAGLLLKLADAENESASNNATGVFTGLFDTAPGVVAPTKASPKERLPVLIGALNSSSTNQRVLAIKACKNALRIRGQGFRMVGPAHQGIRPTPRMWVPSSRDEVIEYIAQVWELVVEQTASEITEVEKESIDALLDAARDFASEPEFENRAIETLEMLAVQDKMRVLERTIEILHYDKDVLSPEMKERFEKLRYQLTGNDFSSLLRRYAGTDIFEDRFDESGNRVETKNLKLQELAEQAVGDVDALEDELVWLTTDQAKDGGSFGFALGVCDDKTRFLQSIVEVQKSVGADGNLLFLGGYLRGLGESFPERSEEIVAELFQDSVTKAWVPELTWRANLSTDVAARRVFVLAQDGVVNPRQLRMYVYGAAVQRFSVLAVSEWLEFLLGSDDPDALGTAADLAHMYYSRDEVSPIPDELQMRLILRDEWYVQSSRNRGATDEYHWEDLANRSLEGRPEIGVLIASKILEMLGQEDTYSGLGYSRLGAFLAKIAESNPREIWDLISKYIEPPLDLRGWEITTWLSGNLSRDDDALVPLDALNIDDVMEWVERGSSLRVNLAVSIVPSRLSDVGKEGSLVRRLLLSYGDIEGVMTALGGRFSSGMWSGNASSHFMEKKRRIEDLLVTEDNLQIQKWLKSYASSLSAQIEREIIDEERGF